MSDYVKINRIQCTQEIAFDMLCAFDRICREEGFAYSLAGGTLLGAIRHKDFIPWDDDVDLFMLRKDYDSFMEKYAGKIVSKPYYKLVDQEHGLEGQTFARMIDVRTKVASDLSVTFKNLWIDILPVDAVPNSYEERAAFESELRKIRKWRVFLNAVPMRTGKTFLRKVLKTILTSIGRQLGLRSIVCKKITETAKRYENSDAKEVAEIVAQGWVRGLICKETFHQSVELEIRGKMFKAMPDYNHYLTSRYGNYLQVPAKNKQVAHKINAKIDIERYEGELKEKLLYYINRRDIEEKNQKLLEEMEKKQEENNFETTEE